MPKYKPLPPLERLNELFEVVEISENQYGEASGLIRKVCRRKYKSGSVAGTLKRDFRVPDRVDWRVEIEGAKYIVARVIYYMTHGKDPGNIQVDHRDRNTLNNNIWNLRLDEGGSIQQVNRRTLQSNTSGVTGVSWDKEKEKWRARMQIKPNKDLGYFTCKLEAAQVINEEWFKLDWIKMGRKLNDIRTIVCSCDKCSTS